MRRDGVKDARECWGENYQIDNTEESINKIRMEHGTIIDNCCTNKCSLHRSTPNALFIFGNVFVDTLRCIFRRDDRGIFVGV